MTVYNTYELTPEEAESIQSLRPIAKKSRYDAHTNTKECTQCKVFKSKSEFHSGKNKDGLYSWCRPCCRIKTKEYRDKDSSIKNHKEYAAEWYLKNKELTKDRTKQWRLDNPEGYLANNKEYYNKNKILQIAKYKLDRSKLKENIPKVYFISDGEYIKIGYTTNKIDDRFKLLKTHNARELTILALIVVDSKLKEKEIHIKFKDIRVRGEWFKQTPELLEFIKSLQIGT